MIPNLFRTKKFVQTSGRPLFHVLKGDKKVRTKQQCIQNGCSKPRRCGMQSNKSSFAFQALPVGQNCILRMRYRSIAGIFFISEQALSLSKCSQKNWEGTKNTGQRSVGHARNSENQEASMKLVVERHNRVNSLELRYNCHSVCSRLQTCSRTYSWVCPLFSFHDSILRNTGPFPNAYSCGRGTRRSRT